MRALIIASLAVGTVTLGAACPAPAPEIKKPVPSFVSAKLRRGGRGALLVRAELDIQNPNAYPLQLEAVDWELALGGTQTVRGRADFGIEIAAKDKAPIALRMRLPPMTAAQAVGRISGSTAQVRVNGIMHFSSERGSVALTFNVAGASN